MDDLQKTDKKPAVPDDMQDDGLEPAPVSDTKESDSWWARLTPRQWTIWQIALGWAFGFAIWLCLALGALHPEDALLSWLFLVVFVFAMIVRQQIETLTGLSMRTFTKHLLFSLIAFLVVFVVLGPVSGIVKV